MRIIRTTIHATIGTQEEANHVLHWRADNGDPDLTPQALDTFAAAVRDKWADFFAPVRDAFSPEVSYKEIRSTYLEQLAPGAKPTTLIDTRYLPITDAVTFSGSSQAKSLPYEVSCVMSLNSNLRGPRNRGRLYLPPFCTDLLGPGGKFGGRAQDVAAGFGTRFVAPLNATTAYQLHIWSRTYATSIPVQGVRIGFIPDSQRRRRQQQDEPLTQAWGTPVGGYVVP